MSVRARPAPFRHPSLAGAMLIELTRGRFAIVDDADADAVGQFYWQAKLELHIWYASRGFKVDGKQKQERLHRFLWRLWGLPPTEQIDHANRDGLDNRRANLRAATRSQNHGNRALSIKNTSGYKGVSWNRRRRKWRAQIFAHGRSGALGHFDDPKEAHAAYLAAARDLFGDFARAA